MTAAEHTSAADEAPPGPPDRMRSGRGCGIAPVMRTTRASIWPLCVAVAAAVAPCLGVPSGAAAEVRSYELRVEGTACLFRAFGLERALGRLEGVRHAEVTPATGAIHLTLEPDVTLLPDAIQPLVDGAGLSLASLSVVARGTVRGSAEGGRLVLGGGKALVLLTGPGTEQLGALLAEGKRALELRGDVRRHGDGWGMVVETVVEPVTPEQGED